MFFNQKIQLIKNLLVFNFFSLGFSFSGIIDFITGLLNGVILILQLAISIITLVLLFVEKKEELIKVFKKRKDKNN